MSTPLQFDARSPRNALPYLFASQAQKEVTVNEALARIDALLHPAVEGANTAPPASPADGECWIVGTGTPAEGAWEGHEGQIACFTAGAWLFTTPALGTEVYYKAAGVVVRWNNGWQSLALPPAPTGGTIVDQEARACITALIEGLRGAGIGV